MADLAQVIKKAAVDAVKASYPVEVVYGSVVTADPLTVKISQQLTVEKNFLNLSDGIRTSIASGKITPGDKIILIKHQGGQRFTAIDVFHDEEWEPELFEETDPTVPPWAKAPQKPSYTAAEVGALPITIDGGIYTIDDKLKFTGGLSPISLLSGTDFNDIKTTGFYGCSGNDIAKTMVNKPDSLTVAFGMEVLPWTDADIVQIIHPYAGRTMYRRVWYTYGNTWYPWQEFNAEEIGVWTPQLSSNGGTAPTYTTYYCNAMYHRIGHIVFVSMHGKFKITNAGSGYAIIKGLPFTLKTDDSSIKYGFATAMSSGAISGRPNGVLIDNSKGFTTINLQSADISAAQTYMTGDLWLGLSTWYPV